MVTPKLNLNLSVGLSVLKITGDLPVRLELAGATGILTDADCSGILVIVPPGLTEAEIVDALVSALPAVIGDVDGGVLTPLITALGLDVGAADRPARRLQLRRPALVG